MTYKEKQTLYREGDYEFPPPPVCHANWDEESWINFIDKEGRWLVKKGEKMLTGVINANCLDQEVLDGLMDTAIDVHYEEWLIEQNPSEEAKDNYCDDAPYYLIGFEMQSTLSSWKYVEDEKEKFRAILSYSSGAVLQVVYSEWSLDCYICSPCYPNQGDLNTKGGLKCYAPYPDLFIEEDVKHEYGIGYMWENRLLTKIG